MKNSTNTESKFVASSGNVFADLGLLDADELLVKADLMHAITQEIKRRGLTQIAAAELTGLDQSDISRISSGRMDHFSRERLIAALRRMGNNVEIILSHGEDRIGRLEVRELIK